jgi:hypothetical protein
MKYASCKSVGRVGKVEKRRQIKQKCCSYLKEGVCAGLFENGIPNGNTPTMDKLHHSAFTGQDEFPFKTVSTGAQESRKNLSCNSLPLFCQVKVNFFFSKKRSL